MSNKTKKICGVSSRHFRRLVKKELKSVCTKNFEKKNIESNEEIGGKTDICESQFNITRNIAEANMLVSSDSDEEQNLETNNENLSNESDRLCEQLQKWSKENNISHVAMNSLLHILQENGLSVPKNAKNLLKTPRTVAVTRHVTPGEYLHFGIESYFKNLKGCESLPNNIYLNIGIDGLPLTKSSGLCLWPILALIINVKGSKPILVGAYSGYKKPNDVNDYLHDFANELKSIFSYGLTLENRKFNIIINAFCCDAPARSFITGTKGHTSIQGCSKFCQVGTYSHRKVLYAPSRAEDFTDSNYEERSSNNRFAQNNVDRQNILESVGIKMVSQFPIEPMHLLDLGIMRKILICLLTKPIKGKHLSATKKERSSEKLLALSGFIPTEFVRKPRSFTEIFRWKSNELRQFALYTGIVVLKALTDKDTYYHFLLFHCAYRLLAKSIQLQ